jgi:site-specific recombinase XerD
VGKGEGHVDFDFRSWVPPARGSAPGRQAASIEMLEQLMEATLTTEHPIRNMAILAVLMGTGVRREECAGLNVEDLNFAPDQSGSLWVRAKVVEGRDVHERLVAFDQATGVYLGNWLKCYQTFKGPLFPALRGTHGRLSGQGIYKLVKALIERAGLEGKIQGPHDLRRAFSTHFERQRRGEGHGRLLSKQLGHARYAQTTQYSLQDVEDMREVLVSPMMLMSKRWTISLDPR